MRWLPVDLVLVSVFAVIGRMSHAEAITVAGWWSTAWPFLTGVLLGWVVVVLTGRPGGSVPAGLVIWAATVIGGMLLRLVVDQGTAAAFVVVATLVLGSGSSSRARRGAMRTTSWASNSKSLKGSVEPYSCRVR